MKSLRLLILFTALLWGISFTTAVAAEICDADDNGYIDGFDIQLIFIAAGSAASGADDPRDADGDGVITINDAALCTLQCTLPNCEIVNANDYDDDGDGFTEAQGDCDDTNALINPGATDIPDNGIDENCDGVDASTNTQPVADAGADQTVLYGDTVTLNGSGSSDADGDPLTFGWSFLARPTGSNASLSDISVVNPNFIIDVSGTYEIQLIVNDGTVDSMPDIVVISTGNTPPVADAGADQTVYHGDVVTLDGSGSSDVDGDSLTYLWELTLVPDGSGASLSDPTAVHPTFVIDVSGTYTAELVVNDGTEDSAVDSVVITTGNTKPVADAGPDQSALFNDTVTLDGSGSYDVDGDSLTYSWSFTIRPTGSSAILSDTTAVNPTFTIDVYGTYVAQLIVNDGTENSEADTVVITTDNTPPVANAGPDQTAFMGDTVQLDGSASSDVDGDSLTFSWSITSRPSGSAATLSDTSAVMPSFDVDVFGDYVVQLIVNDGTENSDPDTVTINILNTEPVADAGADQTVHVNDTVYLDGSGSYDADEDPLTYHWSLLSQPEGSTAILSDVNALAPTFVADLAGEYVAQLIVHDGTIASNPDSVTISTYNSQPQADAGPNQTVYVGDEVNLDGSGASDADGDELSYQWSILSAPEESVAVLSDETATSPTITPDLAGVYVFQLIVNDGLVNSDPDSTTVTVLALPELTINSPSVIEGDEGEADLTFTIALSPAIDRVVSVDYATADSSAKAGVDYTAISGSLTFAPAVTSQTITVSISGDVEPEPDEILFLNLTNPVNATIADPQGEGTILNDDVSATIALSPDPLNLLTSEVGELTVTLNTTAGTGGVVVDLSSDDTDVASLPATVTVPEGLSSVSVDVTAGTITGAATITAAANGYTADTSTVNVASRIMSIVLDGPLVGVGRSIGGIVNLAQEAPAGGVTVSLTSGNTGYVTVSPASVYIAAGNISADFTVNGVAEGATIITATAPGYESATADIAATTNLISIDVLPPIAPDQVIGLPVSLSTPAPTNGVTVYFTMGDSAIASVTPSVFVPEGLQIADANPQVTGHLIGNTTITATAVGYAPHTRDVAVTLSLSFAPDPLEVVNGSSANITLNLSAPAPSSGLVINLSTDDPEIASVPATINIASGQTSATIAVDGVTAGNTVLRASSPGIDAATANIQVVSPPITLSGLQVGKDLQRPTGGYIGAPAPAGNLEVTITSSDPDRLLVSASATEMGSGSITVTVPAGTNGIPYFYLQALADNGSVEISASAPLYATGTATISLLDSTFIFWDQVEINTTTFSEDYQLRILPARVDPVSGRSWNDRIYQPDSVRGGLNLEVAINSSDTGVGVITGPANFSGGDIYVYTSFDSITAGETELVIVQPTGFSVAGDARDRLNAIVTAPKITLGDRDIGIDLQRPIYVILESAPPTPTEITITVVDESIAVLSADAANAGSKAVTFTGVTSQNAGTVYVQGLSFGTTSITAVGDGYATASSNIEVEPAGLYFEYGDINTDTFAADVQKRIRVTRLDPVTGERIDDRLFYPSSLRGGLSVPVTITNSDENVGVLTLPVIFNGDDELFINYFDPLAAGATTLEIVQPGNFSSPSDGSGSIIATVTAPDIYIEDRTVGINLQRSMTVYMQNAPPIPTDITLSIGDSGIALISADSTVEGSSSITFSGVTSATAGRIYVQGIALGNTTLTASGSGFNISTKQITVDNAAIHFRYGDFETNTFADISSVAIRANRLHPVTGSVIEEISYPSTIRGGLNLSVTVTNSDDNVGEIVNSPISFNAGEGGVLAEFDPLTAGVTSLTIVQPPGFTVPSNGRSSIDVTVRAPKVILGDRLVGKNLQRHIPVMLESSPPSPVDVTISMSSSDIAWISKDATSAGAQTVTFSGVTSATVGLIYVQGINLGSAVITGKASGYTDAVNDITVTPAGFYIANYDFSIEETAANRIITIQVDRLDPVTLNVMQDLYYTSTVRGGLSVSVSVSSSNTAAGIITSSPVVFNGGDYSKNTEFDPIAAGNTVLTVEAPSGFSMPSNRNNINVTITASDIGGATAPDVVLDVSSNENSSNTTNAQTTSGSGTLGWIVLIWLVMTSYRRWATTR